MRVAHTSLFATLLCLGGAEVHAQSFHVRSLTTSTFSQRQRLDTSIEAPRLLTQGLELYGFDVLGHAQAPLNARASFRYRQDFTTLTEDVPFALDLLLVSWHPSRSVNLSAGRIWASSALGPQDLDGASLSWHPTLRGPLRPSIIAFLGRDLQHTSAPLAPTTFDVQGLPLYNDSRATATALLAGGQISLAHTERLSLATAYQTRWSSLDGARSVGEERLAMTTAVSVHRAHHTHGLVAYNTLLGTTEHLALQHLWTISPSSSLALGASRRRPWFDAASIFNLFDPAPHDDLSLMTSHALTRATRLNFKTWGRAYHGDRDTVDWFRPAPQDVRATGVHLSQHTSLRRPSHTLGFTTRASYQHSFPASAEYPNQWLLDQRVDLALPSLGPTFHARAIALRTSAIDAHRRPLHAHALSAIVGLDTLHFASARLSLQLEQRLTTYGASSLNVYAMLELLRGL